MREIIDHTRSKRPIKVPDEKDVKNLEHIRQRSVEDLNNIEMAIDRLESDDFRAIVEESKQDMIEIALAAMELEADDVKGFSRAQGQFFERKRLTQKLSNATIEAQEKKSFISNLENQIRLLVKRLQKTKEGKKA